jgi:hypothetical protein
VNALSESIVKCFFIGKQKVVLFPKYRENGWEFAASTLKGACFLSFRENFNKVTKTPQFPKILIVYSQNIFSLLLYFSFILLIKVNVKNIRLSTFLVPEF